jgi:hypothetical protein
MAHTYKDLKRGLALAAKKAKEDKRYLTDPMMKEANEKALYLFSHPAPVFGRETPDGPAINLTWRAMWRVNRYLRRNGIDWPLFDWEALLEWLYENWDKILRVILSLLPLILI